MFNFSLTTLFTEISDGFLNPQKRVFLGYLLSALVIAILWSVFIRRNTFSRSLKEIFSSKIWWSSSSKSDYKILAINKLVMLLLSPALIGQLVIASSLFYALYDMFPSRPMILADSPQWLIGVVFTLCYFLFDDFARFYIHRLMHRWPVLWAFHKTHHSAETMTPLTVFRTHPVEIVLFSLRSTLVQGISIALFVFFMEERADLITVFSANMFVFTFNILGSNLRHSHMPIAYPKVLEKIFISPAQHQIHHSTSTEHWDKNFGVVLSLWDRCFKSFHHSEINQSLKFGITPKTDKNNASVDQSQQLSALYIRPFQDVALIVKTTLNNKHRSIKKQRIFKKQRSFFKRHQKNTLNT